MPVYIGIDWSQAKHDVCMIDATGQVLSRLTIAHTLDGLAKFDRMCRQFGLPSYAIVWLCERMDVIFAHYRVAAFSKNSPQLTN